MTARKTSKTAGWLLLAALLPLLAAWPPLPAWAAESAEDQQVPQEEIVVVVTATRLPQSPEELPVKTAVLTRKELESLPAPTVAGALQRVAEVDLKEQGTPGGLATAYVKGLSSDRVVILVDGRPVNSPQQAGVDLSTLPLGNVERIEVVEGPSSALYGPNAGAVINLITRRPQEAPAFELHRSVTSDGGNRLFWSAGGAAPAAGGSSTGQRASFLLTEERITSPGWRPNSDLATEAYTGRVDFELGPGQELSLSGRWYKGEQGVPGPTYWPSPRARQQDEQSGEALRYRRQLRQDLTLSADLYHNDLFLRYLDPDANTDSRHRTRTDGVELLLAREGEGGRTTLGASWRGDTVESTNLDPSPSRAENGALFLEQQKTRGQLTWSLGGRWDHHSAYGDQVSPRAGLVWRAGAATTWRVALGKVFRAPTFNDLYGDYSPFYRGNPALQPEITWTAEVGARRRFSDRLTGEFSLYRHQQWNRIQATADWSTMENVGEAAVTGLDLGLQWEVRPGWSVALGTTALEGRDLTTGAALPHLSPLQAKLALEHRSPGGATEAGVSARFQSAHQETDPLGSGLVTVPGYTLVDAYWSRRLPAPILGGQARLRLGVSNLFDWSAEDLLGYPLPGRTVTLALSAAF
ncbi:MAG: TonB-dependent receptor [Bacillota bacterium]|nr:TonB-dependent receptor [Bacillota bacterium]